jgi:IMP dehydrogenase
MGSIDAMSKGSEKRYFASEATVKVAQGVSGAVVDKGSIREYLPYLLQGVRLGLRDIGAASIDELRKMENDGTLRFQLRSPAAQGEGAVHSILSSEKR